MGDFTPAADQDAYLPVDRMGQLRQLSGQLMGQNTLGRNPTPVELLDFSDLFRAEARDVAVYFVDSISFVCLARLLEGQGQPVHQKIVV